MTAPSVDWTKWNIILLHKPVKRAARAAAFSGRSGDSLLPGCTRYQRFHLRQHARDLTGMENAVRASGLEWTIARPPRLVQRSALGYRSQDEALPEGSRVMSFGAVAAFMLDCIEQHTHARRVVGLGPAA